jgi:hypothetical protein
LVWDLLLEKSDSFKRPVWCEMAFADFGEVLWKWRFLFWGQTRRGQNFIRCRRFFSSRRHFLHPVLLFRSLDLLQFFTLLRGLLDNFACLLHKNRGLFDLIVYFCPELVFKSLVFLHQVRNPGSQTFDFYLFPRGFGPGGLDFAPQNHGRRLPFLIRRCYFL